LEKNGEIKILLEVLNFILEALLHIESTTQKYIEFQTCTRYKQDKVNNLITLSKLEQVDLITTKPIIKL
jgi:hypothetical protein